MLTMLLLACRPTEAPSTFEEMMVYGFVHFNDEDPEALVALGGVLEPWVEANFDSLAEGYEIASMTGENLAEAGIDHETQSSILGVSLGVDYDAGDLTRFAEAMSDPDQAAVFSHYEEFERVVSEGEDCFVTAECDHYQANDELYAKIALGIEFWSNYDFALRWVDMPDGSTALLHQMSGTEPTDFSVDFINVYQQYAFSYVYTNSNGNARRVQALWADGELLSSDAAEGSYLALSITTMKNANSDINDWMAGE